MKVVLENLKGVSHLEFEIPGQGLWLLTGVNGSGKTSLLAAIYRIGYSHAYQENFKTSVGQNRLDTYKDTKITYHIAGESVTYAYGGTRWRPRPSRNSKIFEKSPYPNIWFVGANASRIEPFQDEIAPRYTRDANENIRSFMSYVLYDNKWDNLKFVNTQRGRGSDAYLLPYRTRGETHYYSEKSFSLGELCIFKLAKKIEQVENGSMMLIDEIEMALHPQAQIRLLTKIQELADEKQLTIIFSTHSSTLIKNINRKKIIFLTGDEDGKFTTNNKVFPAQVLGELAYDEELSCDRIFFVEDEQAKLLLEQLCNKYKERSTGLQPTYKIVPIGGYIQVMSLLDRSSEIFPDHVQRYAFLDDDVRTEPLHHALNNAPNATSELYNRVQRNVKFLPCTPEVGIVDMIEGANRTMQRKLLTAFSDAPVHISQHLMSRDYIAIVGAKPREVAKKKMTSIVEYISNQCGTEIVSIRRKMYHIYCENLYSQDAAPLMALIAPVFNS